MITKKIRTQTSNQNKTHIEKKKKKEVNLEKHDSKFRRKPNNKEKHTPAKNQVSIKGTQYRRLPKRMGRKKDHIFKREIPMITKKICTSTNNSDKTQKEKREVKSDENQITM